MEKNNSVCTDTEFRSAADDEMLTAGEMRSDDKMCYNQLMDAIESAGECCTERFTEGDWHGFCECAEALSSLVSARAELMKRNWFGW